MVEKEQKKNKPDISLYTAPSFHLEIGPCQQTGDTRPRMTPSGLDRPTLMHLQMKSKGLFFLDKMSHTVIYGKIFRGQDLPVVIAPAYDFIAGIKFAKPGGVCELELYSKTSTKQTV